MNVLILLAKNKQATRAKDRFTIFIKGFDSLCSLFILSSVAIALVWSWHKLHRSDLFPVREVSILANIRI